MLASLLYLPVGTELARAAPAFASMTRRTAAALMLGAVLTIPIATFPAYWSTGILGQHRTISVAYFVFLLLWFAALTAAISVGWLPTSSSWFMNSRVRQGAGALLVASLMFKGNGYRLATDFAYGRPQTFDSEMSSREAALRACASTPTRDCAIAPLTTSPESFSVLDLSTDPNDWVNRACAEYFGVAHVVVKSQ
jgi:hypothetical protein